LAQWDLDLCQEAVPEAAAALQYLYPEASAGPLEDLNWKDLADRYNKVLSQYLGLAGADLLTVVHQPQEDPAPVHRISPVQLTIVVNVRFLEKGSIREESKNFFNKILNYSIP
jgi:hypothetical protein